MMLYGNNNKLKEGAGVNSLLISIFFISKSLVTSFFTVNFFQIVSDT